MSGHPLDDYKNEINHFCDIKIGDLLDDLKKHKNRNVTFAGIITMAASRFTKGGQPFGTFQLEDFEDSIQMALFSEDYLKLRHFLVEGNYLLVKARIQNRYNLENHLEIKITNISLLAEAFQNNTREITVLLDSAKVNNNSIKLLKALIAENKGNISLRIKLFDRAENKTIELKARSARVDPTAFIQALEKDGIFNYKLN
jgi:DNA polymerase-3 subunit alpha